MTYLVAADLPTAPAGERFRALARPARHPAACRARITARPALQAKAAGFEALYLSGAAMTASMGLPDLGVITVDEVCFFIRQIARSTGLPLLVDGDTGYGEALNVMHMVRSFEDAGAAAVHIEDQLLPKKCGHLNDKKLADRARHGGQDRRRRAGAPAPVHRRPHRCRRRPRGSTARWRAPGCILEAGADAIFPEALTTAEMFRAFAAASARRAAAGQHDRVRPHAVLHRQRVRGHGLQDGDLAGQSRCASRTRRRRSCTRRSGATAGRRTWSIGCRPGPSCTRRSATTTTRRWTPRSSRPSSRQAMPQLG